VPNSAVAESESTDFEREKSTKIVNSEVDSEQCLATVGCNVATVPPDFPYCPLPPDSEAAHHSHHAHADSFHLSTRRPIPDFMARARRAQRAIISTRAYPLARELPWP
jgi:hypothetical protein